MPALAFRRRSYKRRWGRPGKFVWTLPGPYIKSGSGVAGFIGSGKTEWVLNKTGAGIANNLVGSGADVATFGEVGTGIAALVGKGADAFTTADTGTGIAAFVGSGADVATFVEVGTGILTGVGSGADATTFSEAGTGILTGVGSGSAQKISISLLLRNALPFITRSRYRTPR